MSRWSTPPMPVRNWHSATWSVTHEQKGILIDALYAAWSDPSENMDIEWLRSNVRCDPRKFRRLWTDELIKVFNVLRRERRPVDPYDREVVRKKTDGSCYYCGCVLVDGNDHPNGFHVDHVRPVVRGGTSHIANLVPACRTCNLSKGTRHVEG